jgi:hypothetical protein
MRVDEAYRCYYIIKNLHTPEWTGFVDTLTTIGTGKLTELIVELVAFEARLRRRKDLAPGDALFVIRKNRNQSGKSLMKSESKQDLKNQRKTVTCYGCGVTGHKCRNLDKWSDNTT